VRFDRNGDDVAEDGWFDVSYHPARDFDGKVSGVLSLSIDVRSSEVADVNRPRSSPSLSSEGRSLLAMC
jgi:hypothetical protein